MSIPDTNLYLVGFMGTGKTTVGRAVANRLAFHMLDSDREIEREAGKPVSAIFSGEGEEAFRARERAFIEGGHPAKGHVIACGGGLIVPAGMLELVRARGVVICLHASIETILRRTSGSRHRPLLDVEDPEVRVRELYAAREAVYRRAGPVILTDDRPFADIVNHVLRAYRREAMDRGRARTP